MHIPMEFLSPQMSGTDSGAGAKASRSSPGKDKNQFNNLLAKELDRHDQKMQNKQKAPKDVRENSGSVWKTEGTAAERNSYRKQDDYKKDVPKAEDETVLATGATSLITDLLNKEQEFVSILEGEESVNPAKQDLTPQLRVDNTERTENTKSAESPENAPPPEGRQENIPTVTNKPDNPEQTIANEFAVKANDESATVSVNNIKADTVTAGEQVHVINPEKAEIKDTVSVKQDEVIQNDKSEITGEVTARRPEVGSETSQAQDKSGDNQKDEGNPRPLEYKNETAQNASKESETQEISAAKAAINKAKNIDNKNEDKPAQATSATNEAPPPFSQGFKAIQFGAANQLARAAYEQPVKPENLFQEMIEKVETMTTQSKSTMTIQLNPEHLGKVALEVALDASGIHVKIKAEDNNIRNMINTQLTALIETLETKGLAVSEVEVVYAGANFDNNFSGNGDGRQDGSDSKPTVKQDKDTKGTVEYYTAITGLMDYYLDAGVSTVEYSA